MNDQRLFQRIFKLRGALMVPPVVFTIFCHFHETEDHWVFYAGGTLFALGMLLRVWAQTHLHYRLAVRTDLTETGPYAIVRNPIYIGNTTMLVGLCLLSELVWFAPIMLLWCVFVYGVAVRFEESWLHRKFGADYVRFRVKVPRWQPLWKEWFGTAHQWRPGVHFWKSIVAEAHCPLLVIPYVIKECVAWV